MEIEEMVGNYHNLEKDIRNKLSELENYGKECNCVNCEIIQFIHKGNFNEVMTFCIKCGGIVE